MKAVVGTYTLHTKSEGIYVIDIHPEQQVYSFVKTISCINPSFLHFNRDSSVLYAVQEVTTGQASLLTFSVSEDGTTFSQLTSHPVYGSAPCHISLSPDEKLLIVSNYMSGNFVCYSLNEQGIPNQLLSDHVFEDKSVHPTRQKQSHIHSAFFTPDNKNVFIQNLGGDLIYQFDVNRLDSNTPLRASPVNAGAGPRHICFLKSAPVVYVMNELEGTIDAYMLDGESFLTDLLQKISLNPTGAEAAAELGAHIQLSADNRFLYATNRGERNTISVYTVKEKGYLELIQNIPAGGKGPRFFTFSPDQKWLFCTNQYADCITVFQRDTHTGLLAPSEMKIEIPSPVSLSFL